MHNFQSLEVELHMEKHDDHGDKETAFSESLEELKRRELESKKEIEDAQKRREEFIAQARNDAAKMLDDGDAELEDEKNRIIQKGIKEIEKDVGAIIEKAQKDAEKIRKSASPSKVAEKLLPFVQK